MYWLYFYVVFVVIDTARGFVFNWLLSMYFGFDFVDRNLTTINYTVEHFVILKSQMIQNSLNIALFRHASVTDVKSISSQISDDDVWIPPRKVSIHQCNQFFMSSFFVTIKDSKILLCLRQILR